MRIPLATTVPLAALVAASPATGLLALAHAQTVTKPAAKAGDKFLTQVVEVLGPGTVRIRRNLFDVRVHVFGVTAPADGLPLAPEAKDWTRSLLQSEVVTFEVRSVDARGEVWATVTTAHGKSVGAEMVRLGLARWDSERAPEERQLAEAESEARTAVRGLWALAGPTAVASAAPVAASVAVAPPAMPSPASPDSVAASSVATPAISEPPVSQLSPAPVEAPEAPAAAPPAIASVIERNAPATPTAPQPVSAAAPASRPATPTTPAAVAALNSSARTVRSQPLTGSGDAGLAPSVAPAPVAVPSEVASTAPAPSLFRTETPSVETHAVVTPAAPPRVSLPETPTIVTAPVQTPVATPEPVVPPVGAATPVSSLAPASLSPVPLPAPQASFVAPEEAPPTPASATPPAAPARVAASAAPHSEPAFAPLMTQEPPTAQPGVRLTPIVAPSIPASALAPRPPKASAVPATPVVAAVPPAPSAPSPIVVSIAPEPAPVAAPLAKPIPPLELQPAKTQASGVPPVAIPPVEAASSTPTEPAALVTLASPPAVVPLPAAPAAPAAAPTPRTYTAPAVAVVPAAPVTPAPKAVPVAPVVLAAAKIAPTTAEAALPATPASLVTSARPDVPYSVAAPKVGETASAARPTAAPALAAPRIAAPSRAAVAAKKAADEYRMRWVYRNLDVREMTRYRSLGFSETTITSAANIALHSGLSMDYVLRRVREMGYSLEQTAAMAGVSKTAMRQPLFGGAENAFSAVASVK